MSKAKAINAINKNHVLLVFPIKNKAEPQSLWSCLYPRTKMKWEWDDSGDNRVFKLWHLMKELSESGEVVYSKWFQNRATFFSIEFFKAYLNVLNHDFDLSMGLTREANLILEELEQDSPLSTKEIKAITELQGKYNVALYNRAMKQLYQRGLIVCYGEKDDGAFPSSLIGATKLLFEEEYNEALSSNINNSQKLIDSVMRNSKPIGAQWSRVRKSLVQ